MGYNCNNNSEHNYSTHFKVPLGAAIFYNRRFSHVYLNMSILVLKKSNVEFMYKTTNSHLFLVAFIQLWFIFNNVVVGSAFMPAVS